MDYIEGAAPFHLLYAGRSMKIPFIILCHFPAPRVDQRNGTAAFSPSCGGKRGFTDCKGATFPPVISYTYTVPGKFPNIYGKLCVVMLSRLDYTVACLQERRGRRAEAGRGCSNLGTAAVPVSSERD